MYKCRWWGVLDTTFCSKLFTDGRLGIGKAMRNWRFQVDWGPLSMHPCAPGKFWLLILLFHVFIKVVFYFVSWFCTVFTRRSFPFNGGCLIFPFLCLEQLFVSTNQTKGFTLSILNLAYLKHICPGVLFSFLNNWSVLMECILLSGWIESNYN